ncbi:LOW QUALITY PROTEIN: uncharacterized protein LOC131804180 [Musca domestica]|uniref:LOW QUALITY PROTEIN: uncharacterized protein LOC131804180 n=1 Tax=Musca domestica TaxID=7370 RepID=A0ABM3VA31_MUSDO|nr:LOW QUALITY PROTEIN: uncharacterized protein LOC131804180 [Musca domestica]
MQLSNRNRYAEELKRRAIARQRFRKIVHCVILNRSWLTDVGEEKLSLNVKKNIALLIRPKQKIGLLNLEEKSLIRTDGKLRTTAERKRLVSLMTGLKCFSKLPPKTRARLAKYIKFMVINPSRVLIKQGDMPQMVYFILTGEVEVSKKTFNPITNTWSNLIVRISGPGECIGDIEMLENCPRLNTYTTGNVVELLVVFHEDFERILRPVMEKEWLEKRHSIEALDYFQFFTKDQVIDACKLGILRQFEPLQTIYYEDEGHLGYVYFVLSGECMILQCLEVLTAQRIGHTFYKLSSEDEMKSGYVKKKHFIDVGSITFGGIFGLGEKSERRVIMARTTVQCLMIPRFWLFEKMQNPGNVWQRRRFYLDSTIPSRQSLFTDFVCTRQWKKFKSNTIQSNLVHASVSNPTRIQDVPIICQIIEDNI